LSARAVICAALTALLCGCMNRAIAPVAALASVPGLAAPGTAVPRTAEQVVRAAYGRRSFAFQSVVRLAPASLRVIGLDARGQRLFTVDWDGNRVEETRSPFLPATLATDRLLADLQLVLWPLAAIAPLWRASGFEVTEPYSGLRRVMRDGYIVEEVHYAGDDAWQGRSWLVNFTHGYSLTIDSRAVVE